LSSTPQDPRASETAERFVKQLNVAFKAVRLYPPSSAIPRESATAALATLRAMLREDPDVRLLVTKDSLFHEGAAVFPDQEAFSEFAQEFFGRHLAEVRFHSGVTTAELVEFLRVLDMSLPDLKAAGGAEARLWDGNVVNITVREASTRIVDHVGVPDDIAEIGEEWPPHRDTIDEILSDFSPGRPRDHVVLVRLVESPDVLDEYLTATAEGRGTTPPASWTTNRVSLLASAVLQMEEDVQDARLQALADGLMELDEIVLRDVLSERLLGEARHDEGLAGVVRRMGLERICQVLAAGLEDTAESRDGLTRAFRNLLQITDQDRTEAVGTVGAALERANASEDAASAVLSDITPEQITVRERPHGTDRSRIEKIVRIVDMAPVGHAPEDDADRQALREEAREGITDGDVLGALVTLISIEQRGEQFSSLMSIVEDGLSLLVTRQEYNLAAIVADSLVDAGDDDARPDDQKARLQAALDALASKRHTRAIAAAMRRHDPDTLEHRACRHLLSVLGHHAIEPLLEVLADEPDMTARKALVSLISEMAESHMQELGARLSDERWYFVRNIVTILGSTRTADTLQFLGRTLRYPDPRVRRETIRAVSGISDALSTEMLVAALQDSDAQNVQLAARYLGMTGHVSIAGELENVAMGRGAGNRDPAVRVEAVEAIGRLGSAGSLPLLRSLAKSRRLRGRARAKELASAAQAAIAAIERRTTSGVER
jgi:hypothetical protein